MAADRNTIVKEAQKFAAKGQFDKAIAEWRKLVKESPKDPNLFNTIGDLCLKKNAKTDAVEAYKRAADLLAEDGFTSKAIALYKKVLNIDKNQIDVHLALGDMNAEKGLTGNALENYKFVADHYKKQNNNAKALGIYQRMADLNPANVSFRVKLAEMYSKEGMKSEAAKAFLDAADQHITKEEFQDARKMFEKVLSLDPENREVYHRAGIVYSKEGKVDEARKALKRAFEANPADAEVTNHYLEVLEKSGRQADAEDVFRKLAAEDPSRFDLREKLYQMLLGRKDFDKALPEAVALAEHRMEDMDFAGAAAIMKDFIAATHDPVAGAASLAELFESKGRATDGAQALLEAADDLIARGSPDDAREVLAKAGTLAPDLEEVRTKLAELGGGSALSEDAAAPVEEFAVEEPAEPESISDIEAPQPSFSQAAVEEEDTPAVIEALTEVEVLIKYGLGAKAVEQLEGVVRRFPENAKVRRKLLDLCREQNNADSAVIQALMLAELYEKKGQSEDSRSVLREALDLAPGNPRIMAKLGMAEPEPETPEAIETIEEPEALESIEEVPELNVPELDLDAPAGEAAEELEIPGGEGIGGFSFEAPGPAAPLSADESEGLEEVSFGGDTIAEEPETEATPSRQRAAREYQPPPPSEEESALEEDMLAAPSAGRESLPETEVSEIWAEAEFYYQQGLFDEARKQYEKVLEYKPGDKRAMERIIEITREKEEFQEFSRLSEAVEGLESIVDRGAGPAEEKVTASDVDSVKSLMQEISRMRKAEAETPPAAMMHERAPEPQPAEESEESFADIDTELRSAEPAAQQQEAPAGTDESGDFFDLAAELRDELSTATTSKPTAAHDQSLDEIFEEFKKGVEAHEKKEDEDTHYNLGVAYREMGLLDDAISEFNMTNEGEPKFIQSRYMLGLCFLEKGDYETAISEIQNALGYSYSFGEASEDRIGMHYDLGLAYQGVGNNSSSLEEFQKVFNLDSSYRDVATKVQELQQGDFVSLDAIKEDIEKEISFKFLEEGARIEREEKTKKVKK